MMFDKRPSTTTTDTVKEHQASVAQFLLQPSLTSLHHYDPCLIPTVKAMTSEICGTNRITIAIAGSAALEAMSEAGLAYFDILKTSASSKVTRDTLCSMEKARIEAMEAAKTAGLAFVSISEKLKESTTTILSIKRNDLARIPSMNEVSNAPLIEEGRIALQRRESDFARKFTQIRHRLFEAQYMQRDLISPAYAEGNGFVEPQKQKIIASRLQSQCAALHEVLRDEIAHRNQAMNWLKRSTPNGEGLTPLG